MQKDNPTYQRLFESSNAPILIISRDFKIIECNEMVEKILGMDKDEIIGSTPVDISPEYQKEGVKSADLGKKYFSAAIDGQDQIFEWVHKKKDSSEIVVEVSLFGFDPFGTENFFAMWRDLTEIRKKEIELMESEKRFRTIFSKASDGMLLYNPEQDFGIQQCNEAAWKTLEYDSEKELMGKVVMEFSPEFQPGGIKSRDQAKEYINQCLTTGNAKFEWVHTTKYGRPIWFDIALTKITFSGQMHIHAVLRDISEKKKNQAELEKYRNRLEELVDTKTRDLQSAQSQLIQSEKMASLGILTAGIAHEINNPLNYIMGGYIGISNELEKKEDLKEKDLVTYLDGIKVGVDRAADIIKGLNQLSRENENFNEDCEVNSILDNCINILQSKFKGNIRIIKNFTEEDSTIKGNSGKLHQVFINILSNAIDSISEKGDIMIQTSRKDNFFEIKVEDNGSGISPENLNKITDPFYTSKPPGQGTGLGLYITNTLVLDHHGVLKFESKMNEGTTATVRLPRG